MRAKPGLAGLPAAPLLLRQRVADPARFLAGELTGALGLLFEFSGPRVGARFAGEEGLEGRLRVALRGGLLRATIVARDPERARELESGLNELRGALGGRGFPDVRLAVQGAPGARTGESRPDPDGQPAPRQEDHAGHPDGRRDGDLDSSQGNPRRRPSRRQPER